MHPINSHSLGQTGLLCLFSHNGTLLSGWVKKQVGSRNYLVTNGTVTKVCVLAAITSSAASLPDNYCTFVVSPFQSTADDQYVNMLDSVKCATTAGNVWSWHRANPTSSVARIVNNVQYYNIEQGLIHADPVSGEAFGASFTMTETGKVRVRLCLTLGESEGVAPKFTLQLWTDSSTSLGTLLAGHTYADATTLKSVGDTFLEFTDASTVTLTPGRYWVVLADGPNVGGDTTGAAWFWETNIVDRTVANEYNYMVVGGPAVYSTNVANQTGFQMCVEVL